MRSRYAQPLEKIERRYGVPGPVLVAIWGLETGVRRRLRQLPDLQRVGDFGLRLPPRRAVSRGIARCAENRAARRSLARADARRLAGGSARPSSCPRPISNTRSASTARTSSISSAIPRTRSPRPPTSCAKGWKRGAGWDEGQPNYAALLEWNAAPVYAKTIALFADKLAESDAQCSRLRGPLGAWTAAN